MHIHAAFLILTKSGRNISVDYDLVMNFDWLVYVTVPLPDKIKMDNIIIQDDTNDLKQISYWLRLSLFQNKLQE